VQQEHPRRIVLGIGNLDRGDDAAGPVVAQILRERELDDVELSEHDGEAISLPAQLERASIAVIVDACSAGSPPGTVRRFDAAVSPLPQERFGLSTHGMGLPEAIELARVLRRLPARCIVYAVEGLGSRPVEDCRPPLRGHPRRRGSHHRRTRCGELRMSRTAACRLAHAGFGR
jgi:hydrogenase maturation protease